MYRIRIGTKARKNILILIMDNFVILLTSRLSIVRKLWQDMR